jgi:hypothetical protein
VFKLVSKGYILELEHVETLFEIEVVCFTTEVYKSFDRCQSASFDPGPVAAFNKQLFSNMISHLVVALLALACYDGIGYAAGAEFAVAWTSANAVEYAPITASPGDSVIFTFSGSHDVWMMDSLQAYGDCDYTDGSAVEVASFGVSPYSYVVPQSSQDGEIFYFTCSPHCASKFQKIRVIATVPQVTAAPSVAPVVVAVPTAAPSAATVVIVTTNAPSAVPVITNAPSAAPVVAVPTAAPSAATVVIVTTNAPSTVPVITNAPSAAPVVTVPTTAPSAATVAIVTTNAPSAVPVITNAPSAAPVIDVPTAAPSAASVVAVTTNAPSAAPVVDVPTAAPSAATVVTVTSTAPVPGPTSAPTMVDHFAHDSHTTDENDASTAIPATDDNKETITIASASVAGIVAVGLLVGVGLTYRARAHKKATNEPQENVEMTETA